jgi:hypothetical protein
MTAGMVDTEAIDAANRDEAQGRAYGAERTAHVRAARNEQNRRRSP